MNGPLRILHLEDEPDYCDLVQSLLAQAGYQVESVRAQDRPGFEAALAPEKFDVILADYMLPAYNGLEALRVARDRCPETPFLLVSGTIGEEAAIQSLKAGATDYVLKHWPERLVPAVRRAVEEATERRRRQRVEAGLRESERRYRLIFEGNPTPMLVFDHETLAFLEVNEAAVQHYGYSRQEFLGMTLKDIRPPEDVPAMLEYVHKSVVGATTSEVGFAGGWRHCRKDGSVMDVEIQWSPICFEGRAAALAMINDVTERKRIEHRDAALSTLGQSLSSATSPAEAARIIRSVADDLFHWDAFTLDLYSAELGRISPILNVDTNRDGQRFEIPAQGQLREPSGMAQRIIAQGAELILREEPVVMPAEVFPIGDTSRPSASLMLVPIRNRTRVIGILSIQSYTPKAYYSGGSQHAANAGGPLRRRARAHPGGAGVAGKRTAFPRPI